MDYMKVEALQVIEMVKEKIASNDYVGARAKLLEVQHDHPALDDISSMITVTPRASESDIQSQYTKFTTLLEPIKNNFPGTLPALKIIQDAFSVLSNPEERSLFDMKWAASMQSYGSVNSQDTHTVDSRQGYLLTETLVQKEVILPRSTRCKRAACETLDRSNDVSSSEEISSRRITNMVVCDNFKEIEATSAEISTQADFINPCVGEDQSKDIFAEVARDCIMAKGSSSDSSTFISCLSILPLPLSHAEMESLDYKWSVKDFASGQIWAVYDGPASMPRRYVVVNNVISEHEVCVSFLEPHPMLDDEIYWVKENLPYVCGSFKAGEAALNLGVYQFSHLVTCELSTNKSIYRIFPKKGEIWAMYRNWSSRWKQSDFSHYQCQIVEILVDFSEESGVAASLVEAPGFSTFFQRQVCDGFELTRVVPRKEMLSFSHRIAASPVEKNEYYGIPEGSWHLEPNALPPSFSTIF